MDCETTTICTYFDYERKIYRRKRNIVVVISLLIAAYIFCIMCCVKYVPNDYLGVIYDINDEVDEFLDPGIHFVAPYKKIVIYKI